jgi:hypothetical protein
MTLTEASHWSLVVVTVVVAGVAWWQLQTFKRFELLKLLEDPWVRNARSLLYRELRGDKEPEPQWWSKNPRLERAASTVCASFDIVGLMATGRNRRFFRRYWAHSICWTYATLKEYIDARNPTGYHGYRRLYQEARDRP